MSATPTLAQALGQAASPDIPIWRVLGSLALCLLLAFAGALVLRARLGAAGPWRGSLAGAAPQDRRLKLVETVRLSHGVDVCLLECDGEPLVVASGPHGAVRLTPHKPERAE